MSKLVTQEIIYEGKPHTASVTWSYSGLMKRIAVVGMRLFTKDDPPVEILRVPTDKVSGIIDQLTPPDKV